MPVDMQGFARSPGVSTGPDTRGLLGQTLDRRTGSDSGGLVAVNPVAFSIYSSLVAWWSMDDNAANAVVLDSHSTHNAGTLGFNTSSQSSANAKKGLSLLAGTSSQAIRVPRSDTAFDKGDSDFSWGGWLRWSAYTPQVGGFTMAIFGRGWLTSGSRSYMITHNRDSSTPGFLLNVSADGSTLVTSAIAPTPGVGSGIWYFLIGVHDSVNNETRLYVDNAKTTRSHSGGIFSGGSMNFCMCQEITGDSTFVDSTRTEVANRDECFFVNRAITDAEATYLWNSGAGRSYAGMKADSGH